MMMTEFRIYELTREKGRLYGYYMAGDAVFPKHGVGEMQLYVPDERAGWDGMRICLQEPKGYEELLVMATGWLPWLVTLQTNSGLMLSRSYLPISIWTLYPTDVETGFARFKAPDDEGRPGAVYMVTARRAS